MTISPKSGLVLLLLTTLAACEQPPLEVLSCEADGYLSSDFKAYDFYIKVNGGIFDIKVQDPECERFIEPLQLTQTSRESLAIAVAERDPREIRIGHQVYPLEAKIDRATWNESRPSGSQFYVVTSVKFLPDRNK